MRLKNIPGARERIAESDYLIKEEPAEGTPYIENERQTGRRVLGDWAVKGNWHEVFGNNHPVYIEIGTGKGTFLMELAKRNPDINYVGIEKYSSVILRAIEKQDEEKLPNIRFIRMDAEYINDVFAKGEISRIYLNFSDPWPKARHAKRRLTSREFLKRYETLFADDHQNAVAEDHQKTFADDHQNDPVMNAAFETGIVEFKTDNVLLFDFSLEEAEAAGWPVLAYTRDLHHDPQLNVGNVMTEYEKKFSEAGQKICKMIIKKP